MKTNFKIISVNIDGIRNAKIELQGICKDKDNVVEEITSYHGLGFYNDRDLHDIADDTSREEEINNYIYEQNYGYDKDYDDRDIDSICVLMGIITGSRVACQIIRKKLHFLLPMQPYLWSGCR